MAEVKDRNLALTKENENLKRTVDQLQQQFNEQQKSISESLKQLKALLAGEK
jgi:predicted  nucleic acid-binding Zn-ribbon protein